MCAAQEREREREGGVSAVVTLRLRPRPSVRPSGASSVRSSVDRRKPLNEEGGPSRICKRNGSELAKQRFFREKRRIDTYDIYRVLQVYCNRATLSQEAPPVHV